MRARGSALLPLLGVYRRRGAPLLGTQATLVYRQAAAHSMHATHALCANHAGITAASGCRRRRRRRPPAPLPPAARPAAAAPAPAAAARRSGRCVGRDGPALEEKKRGRFHAGDWIGGGSEGTVQPCGGGGSGSQPGPHAASACRTHARGSRAPAARARLSQAVWHPGGRPRLVDEGGLDPGVEVRRHVQHAAVHLRRRRVGGRPA